MDTRAQALMRDALWLLSLASACMLLQLAAWLALFMHAATAATLVFAGAYVLEAVAHMLLCAHRYPLFRVHTPHSRTVEECAPCAHPDYLDPHDDAFRTRMQHMRMRQMALGDLTEAGDADDASTRLLTARVLGTHAPVRGPTNPNARSGASAPFAGTTPRSMLQPPGLMHLFATQHDVDYMERSTPWWCCRARMPLRSMSVEDGTAWIDAYIGMHRTFFSLELLVDFASALAFPATRFPALATACLRVYALYVASAMSRRLASTA